MKRLRIGVNLLCYRTSQLTGTGRFLKQLLANLPADCKTEFVFFCQRQFDLGASFNIPSSLRYQRIDCPTFGSHFARVAFEQFVLPFKARHLDALFSPCAANPVIHPGLRTITTIHDLTPFFVRAKYGFIQQHYVRLISRLLALTSTRVVTVSESSRADLVRRFGMNESKIDIVYNSCASKDLSATSSGNYFLFVGTLQPAKNLPITIRAFAEFCKRFDKDHHRLVIVGGRGWGSEDYSALASELGIESRISLMGYVSDDELDSLYSGCKGLLLLSLYEGFGIPPLEALTWNKPSIVSNISSLPEVVGRTGIQVDPMNTEQSAIAMREVAEDPSRYLEGREEQLKKFAPALQAQKFLNILEGR